MDLAMGSGAARAGRGLRWVRACVLAVVAVTTSSTAHAVAGGRLPELWTLVLAGAVVAAAAEPLLRRPASTRRVLVLLAGAEGCAHLLLTMTAGGHPRPATMPAMAAIPGMAGMDHLTGASVVAGVGVPTGGPLAALGLSGQGVLMTDAHLAAVVLVGLWLAAGEKALWTVLTLTLRPLTDAVSTLLALLVLLRDLTVRHAASAADVRFRAGAGEDEDRRPPCSTPAARTISHRGPPLAAPLLLGV
jgi:hypothetical protein